MIAILRDPEPVSGAQPEDVIMEGDTLVVVGKAGSAFTAARTFGALLVSGAPV